LGNNNYLPGFPDLLLEIRDSHKSIKPLKREGQLFIDSILQLLLPHFSERQYSDREEINTELERLKLQLRDLLASCGSCSVNDVVNIADKFFTSLPEIHNKLWLDAKAITDGDPAAESIDEVILAYPGFLAISIYRLAHILYIEGVPVIPRIISEYAHQLTGIDIHPGAEIGSSFCIDHGTGIVIGETAVIGNNVKIYQGVTLGALSVEKTMANTRRHPTIDDNVIIYAQSVILGGKTVIGANSIVGGNTWITQSIPPDSVVYNKSDVKLRKNYTEEFPDFII
jgi:serine O-acetyltransferase